jgi:hypothetical protein
VNDRARVPFALVGVLLLVSSATLTATVGTHDPRRTPDVDRAVSGAETALVPALRGAAALAATDAAAAPVTRPANTTAGRALNDSRPFRDALRLRIYLAARQRVADVAVRRGDVTASASLPPVNPTTDGYREAIERVRVERAGADGAALRVEIEGVELAATRDGRTVATADRSPSFVIANPALLLHDRAERFERRANAPVTRPGTGRRLTARLYPVAWTRGYAQYGGAPIANVVANRHVAFATNDALLAEQRAVFDAADPASRRATAAAGRRVAATDLVVGAGGEAAWTDVVLGSTADVAGAAGAPDPPRWRDGPGERNVTVAVDAAADRAYATLVGIGDARATTVGGSTDRTGDGSRIWAPPTTEELEIRLGDRRDDGRDLAEVVDRVHTVEATFAVDRRRRGVTSHSDDRPGPGWGLVAERTTERVDLTPAGGSGPSSDGWSTREAAVYDAVVTETTTRQWARAGETRTTESVVERSSRLRLAVQARTVPVEGAPAGTLDGALSGAADRATERALEKSGGFRGAARAAALGETLPRATATAAPTVGRDRLEADLGALRERTRNLSVTVPAPAVGAGRANPPARLRAVLAARRHRLRGDPGVTAQRRTFLAARAAFLAELDDRLAVRAATQAETNGGIRDALGEHLDAGGVEGALGGHRSPVRPDAGRPADPAGNLTLSVDASPAYLPTGEISRKRLAVRGGGSVRPLAVRNVNAFASPHGQVAESIVDRIPFLGADRVSLATAAEALAVAEGAPSADRRALKREVASANAHVRGELRAAMVDAGVAEREAAAALATDASTAGEARARANGSAVDRAVASVDAGDVDRAHLRVRLETALDDVLTDERARPRRAASDAVVETARERYRKRLEASVARGVEAGTERARQRALGEKLGSIPAGLPVAPVPGYWYATANVWYVDVGGTYERFAVRSDRGGPTGPVTYLRDGRTARLTHDGESVRLGSAERVTFRTETAVVVVVPPGGSGVGDTDGEMDERSAGWPPK